MSLGLNIGVFSNLNDRERIGALSFLFSSTEALEKNSTTVWDLSADHTLINARAWDYLKVVHGKFNGENPVDSIIYKISTIEHFGIMGDETAIRDVNYLILDQCKMYTEEEMISLEAYCDKIVMISGYEPNPEQLNLSISLKTKRPVELWFYSNIDEETLSSYMEKFSAYFKGQGLEFGEKIPKQASIPGFYTFYAKPQKNDFESAWATALTKIFYHA